MKKYAFPEEVRRALDVALAGRHKEKDKEKDKEKSKDQASIYFTFLGIRGGDKEKPGIDKEERRNLERLNSRLQAKLDKAEEAREDARQEVLNMQVIILSPL